MSNLHWFLKYADGSYVYLSSDYIFGWVIFGYVILNLLLYLCSVLTKIINYGNRLRL